jgi:murein DD-endopeptidase MepM/ murein hydrolase activator NlpD
VSALSGPIALVGFLALCVAASAPHALAAPATPKSKRASSKTSAKSSVKKSSVKKSTARTVRTPKPKAPPKPPPPPADIPAVVESASVWRGWLESQDLPKLASSFRIEQTQLTSLLEEQGLLGGGGVAYVAATGGEAGVASAIFQLTEPGGEARTLAFHKTPDGIIVTPGACDCRGSTRRVLNLPAREFTESLNASSLSIPSNVRWQLDILVPQMIGGLSAKRTAPREPTNAASDGDAETGSFAIESQPRIETPQIEPRADGYTVRVVVGRIGDDEPERLESVEILEHGSGNDQGSGKLVNAAWWLDRPDGPGVIIGMDGVAYERLLWQSPVKYVRSARGVGASVTTLRRKVPVKKASGKSTVVRTIKVPGFHLGVDMTAAKGTDVHAVGDAKVAFAGRKGGYGNLIILDHGRGYQTYYAHLSKILKGVKPGVPISRGDVIGLVGSTGRSTAPHLHFETRKDARYLDPFDETRQLGFWLLTADDQERLAMQLLSATPVVADEAPALRQQ